ncbi:MAG: ribonuclease III [Bacteroidota bacterium]|nr:ribonuclease III [Bacteroidota bacterium]
MKAIIGYIPSNIKYYVLALTHRSSLSPQENQHNSNERLEYLGDSILSMIVAEYLYEHYPTESEGFLSQMRARIVNRQTFNKIGKDLNLIQLMHSVQHLRINVDESPTVLGNTFEALVGAMYLDKGHKFTQKFIRKKILTKYLDTKAFETDDPNTKSQLIEWAQKNNSIVKFVLEKTTNQNKRLKFHIAVKINEEIVGKGEGYKKKIAEQLAAKDALLKLNITPADKI